VSVIKYERTVRQCCPQRRKRRSQWKEFKYCTVSRYTRRPKCSCSWPWRRCSVA